MRLPLLRRRVLAVLLVATVAPVAACGDEVTTVSADTGEVVLARDPQQFADGPLTSLIVPAGKLELRVSEPIDELTPAQTRELVNVEPPEGGSFVPVAWRLNGAALEQYSSVLGQPEPLDAVLVTDAGRYQLPAPVDGVGNDLDIFYVAIGGEGDRLDLDLTYDGVTQTLDLRTGERDRGVAKGLYDLPESSTKIIKCPTTGWVTDPTVLATIECNTGKPIVLPYVNGTWAEPGHTFVTLPVLTNVIRYLKTTASGGAADYEVESSRELSRLPGAPLVDTLGLTQSGGSFTGALVFDLEGTLPKSVTLRREYRLSLLSQGGGIDAPQSLKVEIGGSVPLPK